MVDVVVPKLNNNDDSYTLVAWLAEEGQRVGAGDPLVELETSKSVAEIVADGDGVLHQIAVVNAECRHGDVIARVVDAGADRDSVDQPAAPGGAGPDGVVITHAARARAAELGVGSAALAALGKGVVMLADVERVAAGSAPVPNGAVSNGAAPAGRVRRLSRTQGAIAAVVSTAHRTIPAAQAVIKVQVDDALDVARRVSREAGMLIGLPELLIKALAGVRPEFELFFGCPREDGTVLVGESANIGVTVDVGNGLFVPVIHAAEDRPVRAIAEALQTLRDKAGDHAFTEDDLSGMNLMLSLHTDDDLVLATPIIHPGTTAVVCLAGTQHELSMDSAGQVRGQRVVNLGVVYDHRVVNGRDAVRFLQAVKLAMEFPDDLDDS